MYVFWSSSSSSSAASLLCRCGNKTRPVLDAAPRRAVSSSRPSDALTVTRGFFSRSPNSFDCMSCFATGPRVASPRAIARGKELAAGDAAAKSSSARSIRPDTHSAVGSSSASDRSTSESSSGNTSSSSRSSATFHTSSSSRSSPCPSRVRDSSSSLSPGTGDVMTSAEEARSNDERVLPDSKTSWSNSRTREWRAAENGI
mmetsp:Transcript_10039/g.42216  ORF Transcript_10039/g.42216 Transcript_10039/m.42216 type:complete len:201 (-) Transcript_10039:124-726(-)